MHVSPLTIDHKHYNFRCFYQENCDGTTTQPENRVRDSKRMVVSWTADLSWWKRQILERSNLFMNDWDGYGAEALNLQQVNDYFATLQVLFAHLEKQVMFKQLLSVTPEPQGSLLLEWKITEDRSLLLELDRDQIIATDVCRDIEKAKIFTKNDTDILFTFIKETFSKTP